MVAGKNELWARAIVCWQAQGWGIEGGGVARSAKARLGKGMGHGAGNGGRPGVGVGGRGLGVVMQAKVRWGRSGRGQGQAGTGLQSQVTNNARQGKEVSCGSGGINGKWEMQHGEPGIRYKGGMVATGKGNSWVAGTYSRRNPEEPTIQARSTWGK